MVTRRVGSTGRLIIALGVVFAGVGTQSASAQEAPVGLGTAGSFAVLAGQTVTNTGPTVISGDLGVSPGSSVTNFPPGTVNNGEIHAADAEAGQAQADLTTAYNDAAGRATTATVSADLGGQTLNPGVYSGGELEITGTLTLDAQGDPDAVFVFQAASSLVTAPTSTVSLVNDADPCNVFWQVTSSATLGTNSVFVGTVMALTSVFANTGATVEGRLLARNGEVTLDNNVITAPICESVTTTTTTTTTTATATTTTTTPAAATTTTPADGGATTTVAAAATTTLPPITTLPDTGGVIGVTAAAGLLAVGVGSALMLLVARRAPATPRRD